MKKQVLSFLHFQFRKILLFLREKDEIFAFRFSLALFCNSPFSIRYQNLISGVPADTLPSASIFSSPSSSLLVTMTAVVAG